MNRIIKIDRERSCLVYLTGAPDQQYWESLWRAELTGEAVRNGNRFVVDETSRVLPKGSKVIDAGCGIAATVYGLAAAGFEACGIDNADDTISRVKSLFPTLDVRVGDIRALPFDDGALDGIWSLGVIEHFYDGYQDIIKEAFRALRPGGYLFLTVPGVSPLKRIKMRLGFYPDYSATDRDKFFQFALRRHSVIDNLSDHGFKLIRGFGRSGSFGFTEDAGRVARFLFLSQTNSSFVARAWWRLADKLLTPFSFHVNYFLFQKRLDDVVD